MSLATKKKSVSKSVVRPSLLITLKLIDKDGYILDEQVAWDYLSLVFNAHPNYRIEKALVQPNKDGDVYVEQ